MTTLGRLHGQSRGGRGPGRPVRLAVAAEALRVRRRSLVIWAGSVAALVVLFAVTYPTIRGQSGLDRAVAGLPAGVKAAIGLSGSDSVTSPAGYLVSQFFANVFPILVMVFAIGFAARAVAGEEEDHVLEFVLANPISRTRLLLERAAALAVAVGALVLVCGLWSDPHGHRSRGRAGGWPEPRRLPRGIDRSGPSRPSPRQPGHGRRSFDRQSIERHCGASSVATVGFVLQGIGSTGPLRWLRALSPWHWYLSTNPLQDGFGWRPDLLPVVLSVGLIGLAVVRFGGRDVA